MKVQSTNLRFLALSYFADVDLLVSQLDMSCSKAKNGQKHDFLLKSMVGWTLKSLKMISQRVL